MIDVGEAVICTDLAQPFTCIRSVGSFATGVWKTQQTQIPMLGVISVASEKELAMIPEGDVVHGAKVFHTDQQILITQEVQAKPSGNTGFSSDILVVPETGEQYRVLKVWRVPASGYYRAIGVRISTGA